MSGDRERDALVTVCSACKCASCWQGIFVCDAHRRADIEQLPVRELRALDREHESYWQIEDAIAHGEP